MSDDKQHRETVRALSMQTAEIAGLRLELRELRAFLSVQFARPERPTEEEQIALAINVLTKQWRERCKLNWTHAATAAGMSVRTLRRHERIVALEEEIAAQAAVLQMGSRAILGGIHEDEEIDL